MASISKRGTKYLVNWRDARSNRRRSRVFRSERAAVKFQSDVTEELALVREGRLTPEQIDERQIQRQPIGPVLSRFLKHRNGLGLLGDRTGQRDRIVERFIDEQGIRWISDLSPAVYLRFLERHCGSKAGATWNVWKTSLSVWAKLLRQWRYTSENPLVDVDAKDSTPEVPTIGMSPTMFAAVLKANPKWSRLLRLRAFAGGIRNSEAGRLRWRDWNPEQRTLFLAGRRGRRQSVTKNKRQAVQPVAAGLNAMMLDWRDEVRPEPGELMFARVPSTKVWRRMLEVAGVDYEGAVSDVDPTLGVRGIGSVRNSVDSWMRASGSDWVTVLLVLRHRLPQGMDLSAGRYADPNQLQADKLAAIDACENFYRMECSGLKLVQAG